MSRREDIDNSIWSDEQFGGLSPHAKLLYIWSWTNPRCGMSGLYKLPLTHATIETGLTLEQARAAISELAAARFAYHEQGVMFVRTRAKHLRQKTVQIAKSIAADLDKVSADHPLVRAWADEYAEAPWLEGHVRVGRGSSEGHVRVTENPGVKPNEPTLRRPSPEGHVTLPGVGTGTGTGGSTEIDARAPGLAGTVQAVIDVLSQCQRLHVDQVGVENAVAAHPHGDAVQAARTVVTWATDPAFRSTNAAKLLGDALSKQKANGQSRGGGWTAEEMMRLGRETA